MNLGGDGKVPSGVAAALETHFGSVSSWRREFVGAAQSLAGEPGWVVLSYSPHDCRFYNQIAVDHSQAMVGAVPIGSSLAQALHDPEPERGQLPAWAADVARRGVDHHELRLRVHEPPLPPQASQRKLSPRAGHDPGLVAIAEERGRLAGLEL